MKIQYKEIVALGSNLHELVVDSNSKTCFQLTVQKSSHLHTVENDGKFCRDEVLLRFLLHCQVQFHKLIERGDCLLALKSHKHCFHRSSIHLCLAKNWRNLNEIKKSRTYLFIEWINVAGQAAAAQFLTN